MRLTLPALVLLCVGYFAGVNAVLPLCASDASCSAVANSQCTAGQGQPCVCMSSFHENADGTGCQPDATPGMGCTVKNSSAECVNDATCQDTAPGGDVEELKCTCNDGYRPSAPAIPGGASEKCEPAVLPNCVNGTLCLAANFTLCTAVGQRCICFSDYHENEFSTGCEKDIVPGHNCTRKNSSAECVANAVCTNTATEGAAEELKCTCISGFYSTPALDGSAMCQKNIKPREPCTTPDKDECVEGATCKARVGNSVSVVECMCDPNFHEFSQMGVISCAPDIIPGSPCTEEDSTRECVSNATCVNTTPENETAVLECTCDGGFHSLNGSTECIPDVAPGHACTVKDSEMECVGGAICMDNSTDGATQHLQCSCKDGLHQKPDSVSAICEEDFAPGRQCTIKDDNTECKVGATCVDVAQEGADTPMLQCACDDDFHLINTNDSAECKPDLSPGQPCTVENSASECKVQATCVNTAPAGHALSLQCTCNEHHHPVGDSTGSKCVQDTCQESLAKCPLLNTSNCSGMNDYLSCVLSGTCNGSVPDDVTRVTAAFSAVHIADDCVYSPGTVPTCVDRLTLCLNTFLKADTTCGAANASRTCVDAAGCNSSDTENMADLAREFAIQIYAQGSCACIDAADTCLLDATATYNNAVDDAVKCGAVTSMFQCAMTPACDALGKEVDAQKLSSVWASALTKAEASSCTISEADATTCPLKLTRCSVAYATGLKSADNKTKQCTIVTNFEHCIEAVGPACDDSSKRIPLQELAAAVSSYSCECLVGLDHCWTSFNGSLQRDDACSAIGDYQTCLVQTHCNMSDPVDSARVLEVQSAANRTKTDNSCQVTAGTSCQDNVKACADTYITKMTAAASSDAICSAHEDLVLCVVAARCNGSSDADNQTFTGIKQSAVYRHQGLRCQAMTCSATYASLMTCQTSYSVANLTAAGDNTDTKCTAANALVDCLNGLICNDHLQADIRAQYTAVKNANVPSCALKALTGENASPSMRASELTLAAAVTTMLWFART